MNAVCLLRLVTQPSTTKSQVAYNIALSPVAWHALRDRLRCIVFLISD